MDVAFGWKSHSGWAALIVVGDRAGGHQVIDRRRIELVGQAWEKQPYHTAEAGDRSKAEDVVRRGIELVGRHAENQMRAALAREHARENRVVACAVLLGAPMPRWSTEEILAAHLRLHQAEGVLFREALLNAAARCGLDPQGIPEKTLQSAAQGAFGAAANAVVERIAALGRELGAPWARDQKDATLAALIALSSLSGRRALPSGPSV
jgi:hypothetical protein